MNDIMPPCDNPKCGHKGSDHPWNRATTRSHCTMCACTRYLRHSEEKALRTLKNHLLDLRTQRFSLRPKHSHISLPNRAKNEFVRKLRFPKKDG
jgi:hypothetical protein